MKIAIHLGPHCTGEERILKTLLRNKGALSQRAISVPGPGRYRDTLMRAADKLRGHGASPESRDMLLESIVDDDSAARVILSHEDFICQPGQIFENGRLYRRAADRPAWLRNVFAGMPVEFFLAIRNPATFIPAAFRHPRQSITDIHGFLDGVALGDIRWSAVIRTIRDANPDCALTVWCNEDAPLVLPEVLRAIAGVDTQAPITGEFGVLSTIIQPEGMRRLLAYLGENPPRSETHRRNVMLAFLDKYAIPEALEEDLDVPGWTDTLVDRLSADYDADLAEIADLPGVRFIVP